MSDLFLYALIAGGEVVAIGDDETALQDLGSGEVRPIPEDARAAALAGYRLEVVGGLVREELAGAKARLWEEIKQRRADAEGGGCMSPLGRVDTDIESMVRVAGAVSAAQLAIEAGTPLLLPWTMADNSVVDHNAQALLALGMAVMVHVAACHARGRTLRAAVLAAADVEALREIDIESGWPGGPT